MASKILTSFKGFKSNRFSAAVLYYFPVLNRSSVIQEPSYLKNGEGFGRNFFPVKIGICTALTVISGLAAYFLFNRDKRRLSTVYALEKKSNFRKQFNFIAEIAEETANAVVFIANNRRELDGRFAGNGGSGFIVDSNGVIITCAHVVGNKSGGIVDVILRNGQTYRGEVQYVDLYSDLAVIHINGKNLPVLNLSSMGDLRTGEWVVAMGSPLNLSDSVTAGVVSSANRQAKELGLGHKNMQYIQTDATITFGNSGGPLVNLDGEVVGVSVMSAGPGISFAIPIEYVKELLTRSEKEISTEGTSFNDIYIGVGWVSLTPKLLRDLRSIQTNTEDYIPDFISAGLLVWIVFMNSPAHRSGLQSGDILYEVDGKRTDSVADLYRVLKEKKSAVCRIWRKGKTYDIKINTAQNK